MSKSQITFKKNSTQSSLGRNAVGLRSHPDPSSKKKKNKNIKRRRTKGNEYLEKLLWILKLSNLTMFRFIYSSRENLLFKTQKKKLKKDKLAEVRKQVIKGPFKGPLHFLNSFKYIAGKYIFLILPKIKYECYCWYSDLVKYDDRHDAIFFWFVINMFEFIITEK